MKPIWKLFICNRCLNVRVLAKQSSGKPFCDICKARMCVDRWFV